MVFIKLANSSTARRSSALICSAASRPGGKCRECPRRANAKLDAPGPRAATLPLGHAANAPRKWHGTTGNRRAGGQQPDAGPELAELARGCARALRERE